MRLARKLGLLLAVLLISLATTVGWVVATESGTRWLLGNLGSRAPAGLTLGTAHGSLLRGVGMDAIEWRSDTIWLRARDINLVLQLLPLLRRELVIDDLEAAAVELRLADGDGKSSGDTPLNVDLPVDIRVRTARLADVRYVSGNIDRRADTLSLAGDLRGSRLHLERATLQSAWLDLDLSGDLMLDESFAMEAGAEWRWKTIEDIPLAGHLQVEGEHRVFTLQNELREPLYVSTTGQVFLNTGQVSIDVVNSWQQLEWAIPQGTLRSSQGSLRVSGRTDDFDVELDAMAGLDAGAETALGLSGTARLEPDIAFDLDYRLDGLDPAYLHAELEGQAVAAGRVSGSVGDTGPDIAIRVDDLHGTINGFPLLGAASARYAREALDVADAEIRLGDNVVSAQGRVGDPLAIDATVELADLGQVVSRARGSVSGRLSAHGAAGEPEIRAELRGTGLALGDIAIETATVGLSGHTYAHAVEAELHAYGSDLVLTASGSLEERRWSGQLTRFDIANPQAGHWISGDPSDIEASAERVTVSTTCLERTEAEGTACVTGQFVPGGNARLDVTLDGFPLAALPIALPAGVTVAGHAKGDVSVSRADQALTADGNLELLDTAFSGVYMDEQVDIVLSEARGHASITDGRLDSSFRVALADGSGSASLTLAVPDLGAGHPALSGSGEVALDDVSLFAVFIPSISRPRGRIEGKLDISGTVTAPEFLGTITLADGAFSVRQTGIDIADLNVEVAQHEPGRVRLSGSARSGDGTLTVDGYTWFSEASGIRSEISLSGENFELARLPDWQVTASPAINAVFDEHTTTISGELTIPRARVTMREVPVSADKVSPDAVVHRQETDEPQRQRRIDVDVRASLGDDVEFTGFGLTAGLRGAVSLRGGTQAPYTGRGRLSLVDGRYKAYGQELQIERGELLFNGPLDEPLLDVRATRKAGDVVAGIQLNGTPSRLQSDVFSEPALSDAEALSYLLTGRPLADSTSAGEGDVLNKAAFALGLSGAGLVASQIRAQLGLETLAIEGSGEDSKLVAGKRLGNRLLVEYGYGLVDKLGTLLLRYQLNDFLVLESRTGTVSNLDIVYRRRKQ